MKRTAYLMALSLALAAYGCGKSEPAAATTSGGGASVLAQYGFDIVPGAEALGTKDSKEAGKLDCYSVPAAAASYEALVERYKAQLDKSKLQHGLPFPQKLTIDGKTLEFTGVGGMDFSHTVNIFLSKPGQYASGTLLAVQTK